MNSINIKNICFLNVMPLTFLTLISTLLFATNAHSTLITDEFTGSFNSTSSFFNPGDAFSGSYTFESTAAGTIPHPDTTLDTQTPVIQLGFPGTGWDLDVFSSAVANFSISGTSGSISVGNNTSIFGDRYIAGFGPVILLPDGTRSFGFQIDMQDPTSAGADMLSDGAFQSLPNLALASNAGGRFFLESGFGCTQCFFP